MTSSEAKSAFKIDEERDALRESYGRKTVGQSCLLARRLVERGVPFVTVNHKGWDTLNQLATRLKDGFAGAKTPIGLIPSLDRALSGLITDLEQRGMLDETLVVVMGEFGRTPKLNTSGGRDHWPRVFSVRWPEVAYAEDKLLDRVIRWRISIRSSCYTSDLAAAVIQTESVQLRSYRHPTADQSLTPPGQRSY